MRPMLMKTEGTGIVEPCVYCGRKFELGFPLWPCFAENEPTICPECLEKDYPEFKEIIDRPGVCESGGVMYDDEGSEDPSYNFEYPAAPEDLPKWFEPLIENLVVKFKHIDRGRGYAGLDEITIVAGDQEHRIQATKIGREIRDIKVYKAHRIETIDWQQIDDLADEAELEAELDSIAF